MGGINHDDAENGTCVYGAAWKNCLAPSLTCIEIFRDIAEHDLIGVLPPER